MMETKSRKIKERFCGIRLLLLAISMSASGGCAVIPALVSGSAASVEYTITNKAYKVLPAAEKRVKAAVNRALGNLQFQVIKVWRKDGDESVVRARAKNYVIVIRVERVSGGATRLEVDARHQYLRLFKDKSLAMAMITETEKKLKEVQRDALKNLKFSTRGK